MTRALKAAVLTATLAVSIPVAHAFVIVEDPGNIAEASTIASTAAEQLTSLNNILEQAQSLSNQIGYARSAFMDVKSMVTKITKWQWYLPTSRSELISLAANSLGTKLDWSDAQKGYKTTESLFYSSSSNPTAEEKSTIKTRRETALRDSAVNAYTLAQQYREQLSSLKDDVTSLGSKVNGSDLSTVAQAQAEILLNIYQLQVANNVMMAAQIELEAMRQINADQTYSKTATASTDTSTASKKTN